MAVLVAVLMAVLGPASAAAASFTLSSGTLSLTVDPTTRSYSVSVSGKPWLNSAGKDADGGFMFSADGATFSKAKGLSPVGAAVKGRCVLLLLLLLPPPPPPPAGRRCCRRRRCCC